MSTRRQRERRAKLGAIVVRTRERHPTLRNLCTAGRCSRATVARAGPVRSANAWSAPTAPPVASPSPHITSPSPACPTARRQEWSERRCLRRWGLHPVRCFPEIRARCPITNNDRSCSRAERINSIASKRFACVNLLREMPKRTTPSSTSCFFWNLSSMRISFTFSKSKDDRLSGRSTGGLRNLRTGRFLCSNLSIARSAMGSDLRGFKHSARSLKPSLRDGFPVRSSTWTAAMRERYDARSPIVRPLTAFTASVFVSTEPLPVSTNGQCDPLVFLLSNETAYQFPFLRHFAFPADHILEHGMSLPLQPPRLA